MKAILLWKGLKLIHVYAHSSANLCCNWGGIRRGANKHKYSLSINNWRYHSVARVRRTKGILIKAFGNGCRDKWMAQIDSKHFCIVVLCLLLCDFCPGIGARWIRLDTAVAITITIIFWWTFNLITNFLM
jgi:hypothetical protein